MVGTLSHNDTADMLYVKHSVLVSTERLLFRKLTIRQSCMSWTDKQSCALNIVSMRLTVLP